jgi:asparagine synthase (glutamine-hydrolysing)
MCGILGFFEIKQSSDDDKRMQIGRAMAQCLKHRGPDDEGLWQDPLHPLLLGQRRLSIIDLSAEGHQPMESASGRYVITFNGEIYNFQDLQAELEMSGVVFRGRSDTEVMLAAIDRWGLNIALQKLGGMFAFVLWDKQEKQLHFVRDRLGKKPLYVGWAKGALVFGSELKVFHGHPDFKPSVNRDVLALYMRYGCVPAPFCIYDGVWQLPAGNRMTVDIETCAAGADLSALIAPYWHHPRIVEDARQKPKPESDAAALETFEHLLEDAVKQRMVADVPLGAFLSGGIDSSAVVALMQKFAAEKVKTFSVGFEAQGFDEAPFAAKIAAHLGTDHYELYLKPEDALNVIPKLPDIYDEPFADISQIPTYLVSKFAREHVTVALSGDGGDELLGGYNRHITAPMIWKRTAWMPAKVRQFIQNRVYARSMERWDKLVPQKPQFGERIYKAAAMLSHDNIEAAYVDLTSKWNDPAAVVLGATEPLDYMRDPAWQPAGLKPAEKMIYGDMLSYLPNDVLTKVDRASMAASLEARAPLLDHRLFEYAWQLPLDMKVRQGQGKWLLRQVLNKHVPAQMFERPKQGFAVPVEEWLRGPLRDWAEDLLDAHKLQQQGYFDVAMIRGAWERHLAGTGREAHKLWTVLMFQSWLARWQ